ncbi:MAG TPA: hypothetical protein VGK88_06665 [bacterium]
MISSLSPRDRNLLLYALWPAALLAALLWGIGPLAATLASQRGLVEQRQNELTVMRDAANRAGDVATVLGRLRAQDAALRSKVITPQRSVNALVSLQRLLAETGNTVLTVRVGEMERPRRPEKSSGPAVLTRIPVDLTARGSYASLNRFLRRWAIDSIPMKLVTVEASRGEDSSALEIAITAASIVPAPPPVKENR